MSAAEHKELIRIACEWLAIAGYFAWPNRTGAAEIDGRFIPFGKKGSGDILCVLNGGRHAEFEGLVTDGAIGGGGDHDDWNRLAARKCPDTRGILKAVKLRHHVVDDDEVR